MPPRPQPSKYGWSAVLSALSLFPFGVAPSSCARPQSAIGAGETSGGAASAVSGQGSASGTGNESFGAPSSSGAGTASSGAPSSNASGSETASGAGSSGGGETDTVASMGNLDAGDEAALPDGGGDASGVASDGAAGPAVVDTQMEGKMLFGYQGWFACPNDGSTVDGWQHWLQGTTQFQVDFWPDLSEFSAAELFAIPGMTLPDGGPAAVFSAYPAATVARHFQWMREYGIDGALLQRFLGEVQDPRFFAFRNQVTKNVTNAAEAEGRIFAIEYDLSGVAANVVLSELETDWMSMVDTLGVLQSSRYLHVGSKPALFVWGLGFPDRPVTPAVATQLIAWLQTSAPAKYRVAVVGGVPSNWRTLTGDSSPDPGWAPVYRSLDVVSPWSVGRFGDASGADQYEQEVLAPDLAELKPLGVGYLPVVFPGFSWHNLNGGPLNQIPRNGGTFYWRQVYNAMTAGATMMKTAMFDEMNEGTAMLKMQTTSAGVPTQASFVTLDIDGLTLQSDHYLSLGGAATRMVHGDTPVVATLPALP
jgi:hypothetical protein